MTDIVERLNRDAYAHGPHFATNGDALLKLAAAEEILRLRALVLATQEKCAQVARMAATVTSNRIEGDFGHRIASAIRSLNLTERGNGD